MEAAAPGEPTTEPVASALAQAITGTDGDKKKKKKKKKKKLSAKAKRLERMEKLGEAVLANPVQCNEMLHTVAFWLEDRKKSAYKLFHAQCIQTIDHKAFMKTVKIAPKKKKGKKGKKGSAKGSAKSPAPEPEPEPEPEELDPEENPDEIDPDLAEINTLSTIDFKISYEDFKLVVQDLGMPCTEGELHAVCMLLDPDKKMKIDFRKFNGDFLKSHLDRKHRDGIKEIVGIEKEKFSKIFTFHKEPIKYFATQYPLYIKLDLRLVTFANEREYWGHLRDVIISIHEPVYELIEIIKERTDIATSLMQVYKEASKSKGTALDENRSLEYYGYAGGQYNDVKKSADKIMLFYDYATLGNDCPILNSDFYFSDYSSYRK